MPVWKIYAPENTFTYEQKRAIAAGVTEDYAKYGAMPRFYVVVVFEEVSSDSFFVGGESVGNFVRIVIAHIARTLPTDLRPAALDIIESKLAPHIRDRGLDWELHIDETPIDLWRVQGLPAPEYGSEAEKKWIADNKPTPYHDAVVTELSDETVERLRSQLDPRATH